MVERGVSLEEVGRILGHRDPRTTWRYFNRTNETIQKGAKALDEWNSQLT